MLGNWVEYMMDDNVISPPVKVELISNQCVDVTNGENSWDVDEGDLLGIPITEELLEKCGFRNGKRYWFDSNEIIEVDFEESAVHMSFIGNERWNIKYIFFLHDLQNAYFMLTKKHFEVVL